MAQDGQVATPLLAFVRIYLECKGGPVALNVIEPGNGRAATGKGECSRLSPWQQPLKKTEQATWLPAEER